MQYIRAVFVLFAGLGLSLFSNAKIYTAECSELKGPSTYYLSFISNPEKNDKLNEFDDHMSGFGNQKLFVIWEDDKIPAKVKLTPETKIPKDNWAEFLKVGDDRNQRTTQMTFFGYLNDAPILVSIYPNEKVAIYTQHSMWRGILEGVRTQMFHAKCEIISK